MDTRLVGETEHKDDCLAASAQWQLADNASARFGPASCPLETSPSHAPQLAAPQGATAHFLRVGPHTVFTFLILEQVQRLMRQQAAKQQQQAAAVAAAKQS